MLESRIALAGRHGCIKRVARIDRAEFAAIAQAKALDRVRIEQHFADGLECKRVECAAALLRHRIEPTDLFDRVAEQIEPHGLGQSGREKIDDAAAQRVFARLAYGFGSPVAVAHQKCRQIFQFQASAAFGFEHGQRKLAARRHALRNRVDRGEHDTAARFGRDGLCEIDKRVEPAADDLAIWRHAVVGQAVPGRKRQDLRARSGEHQLLGQQAYARVVARDMQHVLAVAQQGCQNTGIYARRRACNIQPLSGGNSFFK